MNLLHLLIRLKEDMKLIKIRLGVILLLILLSFRGFSQDSSSPHISTDTLKIIEDSTRTGFQNEQWLRELQVRAMIRLWSWDNEDKFNYPLEIYYSQLNAVQIIPDLSTMINIHDPYANPEYDFRDDPAYRLGYAQEIIAQEQGKPSNVIWVSPLAAVYLAYLGFRELGSKYFHSSPNPYESVNLSAAEIEMVRIIWENPELSATDWYRAYYQRNELNNITFLGFKRHIDELLKKKIIATRKVFNEGNRYFPTISRSSLIYEIEKQRQSGDVLSDSLRYRELLRMKRLLKKGSELQDSVQTR